MNGASPSFQYSCAPGGYAIKSWGSYASVFNRRTGETHLISILPAEILDLLTESPLDLHGIAKRMAELCETPNSPKWADKIQSMIDELVRLELIDPLPI